ncbi:hypothetical protein [Oceanobacter mangrovi]|uniref:hypothetical protein n=1 Tax=Oceanobacter mangrovi TaxID=2862510 RepID=UPI001C8EBF89|nr:hypothetical protein [Oceanobacter mangrovi]
MKTIAITAGLLSGMISISASCHADALMNNAEYHISVANLQTFSGSAVVARLCDSCEAQTFTLTSNTRLLEYERDIDLQRASELYLRKNMSVIFLGVDRAAATLDYINFGGHATANY